MALRNGIRLGGYPNVVSKYTRKAIDRLCSGAELRLGGGLPRPPIPSGGWRQDAQFAFRTLMHPRESTPEVENVFGMRLEQ
jgi:hypothetical protein